MRATTARKPLSLLYNVIVITATLSAGFGAAYDATASDAAESCQHQAASLVDCLVRSDAALSALNTEMLTAYQQELSKLDKTAQRLFRDMHRGWMDSRAFWLSSQEYGCKIRKVDGSSVGRDILCLRESYHDRIAELTQQCEEDRAHTIEQMAAWKKPWSSKIPAGFKIDHHQDIYITDWSPPNYQIPSAYSLPSTKLPLGQGSLGGLKPPYPIFAVCRVRGPDEKWWIVGRWRTDLSFWYIPESDTKPASVFYAK